MDRIRALLADRTRVATLAAFSAALFLIFALPLLLPALRPAWIRIAILVAILALWAVFWRRHRAAVLAAAASIEAGLTVEAAADAEEAAIRTRMSSALQQLRGGSGWRSKAYLYEKPWYVIIGPPGAGKTTALVNSGLHFPLTDQTLQGVGGTRNLDFMFTDEAILLDTAGRYTSQDSDDSVDARGWQSFLGLLAQHRPEQPINGLILAIPIDELAGGDVERIDMHAEAVRRRLAELRRALGVIVPVYLFITKADLLAGFMEYFAHLDAEQRRQPVGHTFAVTATPSLDGIAAGYDELVGEIAIRQPTLLHRDADARRRSLILGFPSQLSALRNRILRFMSRAFLSDPGGFQLRGLYLTSGVQQGAPLDQIIAGLPGVRRAGEAPDPASARAFFINRVLTDVMFKEAGLVQFDGPTRRQRRRRRIAGLSAIAGGTLAVVTGLVLAFLSVRQMAVEAERKAADVAQLAQASGVNPARVAATDAGLVGANIILRELRRLPGGYDAQDRVPLAGLGLGDGGLPVAAIEAYRDANRRILLPRLLLDIEATLAAPDTAPLRTKALDVYLMLGGLKPVDRAVVHDWFAAHWTADAVHGGDRPQLREELLSHLDALLADDAMLSAWAGGVGPLDAALVNEAAELGLYEPK
jgi:type VI secretion system protein ImpL